MLALDLATLITVAAPLLLTLAALIGLPLLGTERPGTRLLIVAGIGSMAVRYLLWRLGTTIPWRASWAA